MEAEKGPVEKTIQYRRSFYVLGLLFLFTLISCGNKKENKIGNVDFNFQVKPILSDKCFTCHGPDAAKREANLRLDTRKGAMSLLAESQDHAAIVPGDLNRSHAYRRITHTDPQMVMPPPESRLKLSPQEIEILSKWIKQGATYKKHWAFILPIDSEIPAIEDISKINNPIDHFVLHKLQEQGLTFSQPATKETLIRRASFDVTGLPPTLQEIDHFLQDNASNAFEKVIDRLLASDAYGERMASYWMDVARYADSDGYLDDKHRDFSPWRDWVIKAFNQNMPYDQFVTWQLAGDLLPNASSESILATAFNRLNKRNSEAGIVFEEYRVEYAADRTNTFGTAFMGVSLECARCHDHKYDPITQKDYYQLFGFYNSTFELGTAVYGPDQTPGPSLLLASATEKKQLDSLHNNIEKLKSRIAQHQKTLPVNTSLSSSRIHKKIQKDLAAYYPLDDFKNRGEGRSTSPENLDREKIAVLKQPVIKPGKKGKAFFVTDYNELALGKHVGWYDRTDPFSVQFWIYPDTVYEDVHFLWHCEDLRLGLKGYTLALADNKLKFVMAHSWPQNAIQVTTNQAIPPKKWSHITLTYDGSSDAKGAHFYVNGTEQTSTTDLNHLYKGILFKPDIHTYGFKGLVFGARDKFIPFINGGIDEIKVYNRVLMPLEVMFTYDGGAALSLLQSKSDQALEFEQGYFAFHYDPTLNNLNQELKNLRAREHKILNRIPEIMVMGDLPEPRPTYLLERGRYDMRGEQVTPGTPDHILAFEENLPKNRLGLSKWLFDEKNPLPARVFVNRIWQLHFGTGIVKTSEDFGNQGSLPSHPALLDWLAIYFQNHDWDIKALHKLMLTSTTYMQSSAISTDLDRIDPENRLLARGPRFRLPAEMIRDNALAISGLLVEKPGGKSAYPYQPDGIWDGLTTKSWAYKYLTDPGEGLYRRSMYTIWKRTAPPPSMLIFDIADRGICTVRRKTTNTPLQALVLLNDPQFVEAARVLAERLVRDETKIENRLTIAFRLITGRQPDLKEANLLREFYEKEWIHFLQNKNAALDYLSIGALARNRDLNPVEVAALSIVVNSIMSTDEGYTRG